MKYYLAIDIGASSGRHILGSEKNGEIVLEEVYRFKNGVDTEKGHLVWNTDRLFNEIKTGIRAAIEAVGCIQSLAIDTWGVDYLLMHKGKAVLPCYAYRDGRTVSAAEEVHKIIKFSELYKKTGIAFNTFNTIYQLYADKVSGRLDNADAFLMLPEYFSYLLTGKTAKEYTNATTTGLVNCLSHKFDTEITEKLGLPNRLFTKTVQPGYRLGKLSAEIAGEAGANIDVVLCASHDTASAVIGIPMQGNAPYISSGTWSLVGIKTDRAITDCGEYISNEGGPEYTFRYQKNIMGMWIVNKLKETLETPLDFSEMERMARASRYDELIDVNATGFLAPDNMKNAIIDYIASKGLPEPVCEADIIRSVYRSLAYSYAQTLKDLEKDTCGTYSELYIVGGGARNAYLNELTADFTGKKVIALPIEATALGNIKIQMRSAQNKGEKHEQI